jgi:hypothetical protein
LICRSSCPLLLLICRSSLDDDALDLLKSTCGRSGGDTLEVKTREDTRRNREGKEKAREDQRRRATLSDGKRR